MYGIIEVPEPFYDYGKKDKAAVAARWASETAASADVEADKKASKQKAVQQAKADDAAVKAVTAAKAAAKAAKRAAKKSEKNAAAEHQSEPAEKQNKGAAGRTTMQEAAVQVQSTAVGIMARLSHTRNETRPLMRPCIHAGVALTCKAPAYIPFHRDCVWWSGGLRTAQRIQKNCEIRPVRQTGFPYALQSCR